MSTAIIPVDILETLVCNNCYKYLSVKPIKVSNKKVLCGRCVGDNDEFAKSLYNIFVDNVLFSCINDVDGCDKLLLCDQVKDHEYYCKSKQFGCLLCPKDSPKIPTYMLAFHVKTQHGKSILKTNSFTVDLVHLKNNILFYQKENSLFFIEEYFDCSKDEINFSVISVGKNIQLLQVNLKYFLTLENSQSICEYGVENWSRNKNSNISDNSYKFVIKINKKDSNLVVTINFEILTQIITKYVNLNANIKTVSNLHNLNLTTLIKNTISNSELETDSVCNNSRLLRFDSSNSEINHENVYISSCQTKLVIYKPSWPNNITICFHCILCNCILKSLQSNFVTGTGALRHLVCQSCKQIVSEFISVQPLSFYISNNIFHSIQYSCIDRCNNIYISSSRNGNIVQHYQSKICKKCPFENCNVITEGVDSFRQHFQNHTHSLHFVVENFLACINISSPLYPKKIYVLHYYLLIEVYLELINGELFISAQICDRERDNVNLVMFVMQRETARDQTVSLNLTDIFFQEKMKLTANENNIYVRFLIL